jgi:hypothetical protein
MIIIKQSPIVSALIMRVDDLCLMSDVRSICLVSKYESVVDSHVHIGVIVLQKST